MRAFIKMHGLGNDFVVVDAREVPFVLDDRAARALADRREGVGCDQIVVLERGRVAAAGSHAELLAAGGWYARALAKQRIDRPAVREEAQERRYAAPK